MGYPTQDELKSRIQSYYKDHLSSGLQCEVKSLSMSEETETGGKNITATLNFLHSASGEKEDSKVLIPCDESGNLDWTNTKFLDDTHNVDPSKVGTPAVKSPEPLPANNKKPDTKAKPPAEKISYIQDPKKVGAQGGKKVKGESRRPTRTGYDELGWPTAGQLELEENQLDQRRKVRDGYANGEDDWEVEDLSPAAPEDSMLDESEDEFDVFKEAGISPVVAQQAMASRLSESVESPRATCMARISWRKT